MPPLSSRSFYRDLLHDAWQTAWHARLGWLLAIGAGLLQTGGIIDVLYRVLQEHLRRLMPTQGASHLSYVWESCKQIITSGGDLFGQIIISLRLGQTFLLALLMGIAVLALAVLCQGALVYLIGARGRFTRPTLQESLKVGGERFWAVAALNLIPFGAYIFAWFVCLAPFGRIIPLTSPSAIISYVVAVMIALITGFAATALHMLAMQSIVLEEAHVLPALKTAWQILRRSWFTILETSLGLFALGMALFLVSLIGFIVIILPLLAIVGVAIILQAPTLANTILLLCVILFIAIMGSIGGFAITFQYTVWNRLASRLQKNLGLAKVIRTVHRVLNQLKKR